MSKGKKKKLKAAKAAMKQADAKVHDRRATDLTLNSKVAVAEIESAYGYRDGAAWDGVRGEWLVPDAPTDTVVRSLRDDPLAALAAAKQIDDCQYKAGRHWQRALLLAEIGAVKAIDPGKEAVDGGQLADPISEVQRKAIRDLSRCDKMLGAEGAILVRDVLERRKTIAILADERNLKSEAGRKYLGKRFRECLDTLAYALGYSTTAMRGAA